MPAFGWAVEPGKVVCHQGSEELRIEVGIWKSIKQNLSLGHWLKQHNTSCNAKQAVISLQPPAGKCCRRTTEVPKCNLWHDK